MPPKLQKENNTKKPKGQNYRQEEHRYFCNQENTKQSTIVSDPDAHTYPDPLDKHQE